MLREGLATEFPFVVRALGSIRRPRVAREDPRWAALSAFGAAWIVTSGGQIVAMVLRLTGFRDPASWTAGGFSIVGAAVGIAVAVRSGGRRGLVWYAAALVALVALTVARQLPGFERFCAASGGSDCSLIRFALPHVYTLGGAVLSVAAVRAVAGGPAGANPVLAGAGGFTVATSLASGFNQLVGYAPGSDATAVLAINLAVVAVGALAMGIVLRVRASDRRPVALAAALLVGLWAAQDGPFLWAVGRSQVDLTIGGYYAALVGPTELAGLLLGWAIPLRR